MPSAVAMPVEQQTRAGTPSHDNLGSGQNIPDPCRQGLDSHRVGLGHFNNHLWLCERVHDPLEPRLRRNDTIVRVGPFVL